MFYKEESMKKILEAQQRFYPFSSTCLMENALHINTWKLCIDNGATFLHTCNYCYHPNSVDWYCFPVNNWNNLLPWVCGHPWPLVNQCTGCWMGKLLSRPTLVAMTPKPINLKWGWILKVLYVNYASYCCWSPLLQKWRNPSYLPVVALSYAVQNICHYRPGYGQNN